ncbi:MULTISPECIES: DUF257 family protein [Thermococcus]|uniref:Biotin synthase n=1 Tax=Thermococcus thioreducens TaxID=277988 RepID=A0A0Q2ULS7_9EURY|nr:MULTISPECIES: DUF257 family protein [Thermococcus]ASJ13082.1 biotin synthase [Thermococcus thioreducens]KQH81592.1 biotin synthase [Thermococcus thioreducens]SEV81412.1 protein of unknown function, DUF257 [Thermococcus thioreducens]
METSVFEKYLFGRAERGDTVLIEYPPTYPLGKFSWGFLIPSLIERGGVVIGDFFGIGDLLFRNYIRRVSGKEYSDIIELIKKIKVVKIGPGSASYGEVIEEVVPVYDSHSFLKNYHTVVNRMTHSPTKPEYFVTFGLSHYVHFGGDEAMKAIMTGISTIPMEDWVGIHFLNVDVLSRVHLAMLEEMASIVFQLSDEEVIVKKGGEAFDSGGG